MGLEFVAVYVDLGVGVLCLGLIYKHIVDCNTRQVKYEIRFAALEGKIR